MANTFVQRIITSSYHICAEDRRKMHEFFRTMDIGHLPIGGLRSDVAISDVSCPAQTIVQIVQADEYREAILIFPPNDPNLVQVVIGWKADVSPTRDMVLPVAVPFLITRRNYGGLVTAPIWAYYIPVTTV